MKQQNANTCQKEKLPLENCIKDVLTSLLNAKTIETLSILKIVLNLNNPFLVKNNGIVFNPSKKNETFIEITNPSAKNFIINSVLQKYIICDLDFIKNYIKHKYTHHLSDKKKSNLGKYCTPENLVNLVFKLAKPYIRNDTYILDMAAGCGAFLEHADGKKTIGRDIDKDAIEILKTLDFKNVEYDNSLMNVSRGKYHLSEKDHLVIVGNPPYNDVTSKNKKYGVIAKEKVNLEMDWDILTKDYGISFLKAFNKLKADVICVLHPLSYLIKETNFNKLNQFTCNYILENAVIFSSREFSDTQQTPFPVIAALYLKGRSMDYEYIKSFRFNILNSNKHFVLQNIETIDGYIRKYPPTTKDVQFSDIGLYMYNIRDINSLLTSGNLTEKENHDFHITIQFKDFYKYAYLNCMKRYFEKDFLFGNLSPIVDRNGLETDEFLRDVFIIDTIIHNQKILILNVNIKDSIIYTKSIFEDYQRKEQLFVNRQPNIYRIFIDFVKGRNPNLEPLKVFIKKYFEELKAKDAFIK